MSFFSRLFAKLFGKKKEQEQPRVPYTPTVVRPQFDVLYVEPSPSASTPPYPTTGKFQQQENPRIPAISVPATPPPSGWPPGAYEFQPGVWYVPDGSTNAGPFATLSEYKSWKVRSDQLAYNNALMMKEKSYEVDGHGTIPTSSLSKNDAAYIHYRSHDYKMKRRNGDLFREVCSGPHLDIARAIQDGDILNPGMNPWTPDNPALPGIVDNIFASIPVEDLN